MTPMTRSEVLDLIVQAREHNLRPNLRGVDMQGVDLRGADLRGADLRGADLRYADLRGASLRYADMGGASLRYADLRGADLRGASLRGASLRYADLREADLRYADLREADMRYACGTPETLVITGLPSGNATLAPWADGWELRVGCWYGTPDSLAELIATDEGWPEATGEECARRRPLLEALIVLCRAWIDAHPDAIEQAAEAQAEGERIRAEARNE